MEGTRVNHLEEDSKVEVHGLVSQTALNGRRGTVVGMRNNQGRWPVVLDPDTNAAATTASASGAKTKRWWLKPETLWALLPCSACGVLKKSGVEGELGKCRRCRRVWYCSPACQREHWKSGGHKKVCASPACCVICLDNEDDPLPIQTGCACRGEAAWAHVGCKAQVAEHHAPGEWNKAWHTCLTCKQPYSGMFRLRLARKSLGRFVGRPPEDEHRLSAQDIVASALAGMGRQSEALNMKCENLAVRERVFGEDHPNTMGTAFNLGNSLYQQRKYQEAETLARSLHARQRAHPKLGEEHADTLNSATLLATCFATQGKDAEAAELQRATLATQRRVLGEDHRSTLETARHLGQTLGFLGEHDEAVALLRDTLAKYRRVLGRDHEATLLAALLLGRVLVRNPNAGDTAKGTAMVSEALVQAQHVLGPGHPRLQHWKDCFSPLLHA